MGDFTPVPALLGGVLLGLAASLLLLTHGAVAGISGLFGGLLRRPAPHARMRTAFLLGLAASGLLVRAAAPFALASSWTPSLPVALVSGLLVGVGTHFAGGCTSGHGVCGLGRFSLRSLVATGAFMVAGVVAVYLVRHVMGGAA